MHRLYTVRFMYASITLTCLASKNFAHLHYCTTSLLRQLLSSCLFFCLWACSFFLSFGSPSLNYDFIWFISKDSQDPRSDPNERAKEPNTTNEHTGRRNHAANPSFKTKHSSNTHFQRRSRRSQQAIFEASVADLGQLRCSLLTSPTGLVAISNGSHFSTP